MIIFVSVSLESKKWKKTYNTEREYFAEKYNQAAIT